MTNIDDQLMSQFVAGDQTAFTRIVDRHKSILFQFILSKVRDPELASDLTQDVFVRLFQAAESYQPLGKLRSWLIKIAQNLCVDFLRKQPRARILAFDDKPASHEPVILESLVDTESDPMRELEQDELRQIVEKSLAELPEKQRTAFWMCQFQGLSYPEIARIQVCPVGTVKSRIYQALVKIRADLKSNHLL